MFITFEILKQHNAFIFLIVTDYVMQIMKEVMDIRINYLTLIEALEINKEKKIPAPLTNDITDKIDEETAIEEHVSRFNM